MNTADKKKLEQKINAEIRRLIAYTSEHEAGRSAPTPETDTNVKIEELAVQAVDQHVLTKARKKVIALRSTLASIDDESFGLCANCGEAISLDRLLIVPDTRKCLDCAT